MIDTGWYRKSCPKTMPYSFILEEPGIDSGREIQETAAALGTVLGTDITF